MIILITLSASILVAAVTWSDYEMRLTTYTDFDGLPAIIETDDMTLWIFWTRKTVGRYAIFYKTSFDRGANWSADTELVSDGQTNTGASVCQTSDGSIWLVWASDRTGDYELFYKISHDYGVSWGNDTQLTFHSSRDLKPTVRQMSDGAMWIVWASDRNGGYDLYLKTSPDSGDGWSNDTQITFDSSHDKMPSLAQVNNGTIWLVWASDRTSNYDLYCKTSSDLGVSWTGDTQMTNDPKIDSNPCVFQTMDEQIWVFWSRREASEVSTDDIFYMFSADNGVTWSSRFQFTSDNNDDIWPSVTQTRHVDIWVTWTSDRADQPDWGNYDIYYRTSLGSDVNSDGAVDVIDLTSVSLAYGTFEGEPDFNPEADINTDGIVDMRDLSMVAHSLGAT